MTLSSSRLERLHRVMKERVQRGLAPGIVALISHGGEVHVDTIGNKRLSGDEPMERDIIFRIASLTKPVVAAATMMLIEECVLRLDDPVGTWLPELADRRVLKSLEGPIDDTVPAHRPITVRDLLTMRMGFGAIVTPGRHPIAERGEELEVMVGPPVPQAGPGSDEWIQRLGTLPLMHQPGEGWMYDTSFRVLGVLLERATGQPVESLLQERIFEPLGMKDSGFTVSEEKLERLASCYAVGPDGDLQVYDDVPDSQWASPPVFPDTAGGLVSTVDDFLVFGNMMLNQGKSGDQRILSQASVETMTTPQISEEHRASAGIFLGENRSWGFGVSVIIRRDDIASGPGRYGWDGGFGTSWYNDPAEDLVAVLMSQRYPPTAEISQDFWTLVYQALDD